MIKQRKPVGRWPAHVPGGATPLDRAREIARGAVAALAQEAPAKAEMIVRTADMFGETWLRTYLDNGGDADEIMSAAEAALLVGVKAGTIRKWHERGFIDRIDGGYRRSQVLARKRELDLAVTEREAS